MRDSSCMRPRLRRTLVLTLLLLFHAASAARYPSAEDAVLLSHDNEGRGQQTTHQDEDPIRAVGPKLTPHGGTSVDQGLATGRQGPRRTLQQGYWSAGPRWPWQVNGFVGYFATPIAAGSASVSGDAKAELFYDGTIKGGAGLATSTSLALGRAGAGGDSLGVGNPRWDRPFVATQAYVTVPRWLGWTTFPTLGYTLAEGRGSTASANQGYFVVSELAYNPLSNSFGLSLSQAQSNAISVPALLPGSGYAANQGFSGLEQIGGANSLTLFTDPRTIQFAQAVAYPFSILTPGNPLTCTQTMINSVAWTWGDLGGPVRPTPRNQPIFLVPFCAEFFNANPSSVQPPKSSTHKGVTMAHQPHWLLSLQDYYYGYDDAYYQDYDAPGDLPGQPGSSTYKAPQPRSGQDSNSKRKTRRQKQPANGRSSGAAAGAAHRPGSTTAADSLTADMAKGKTQANHTTACQPPDTTTALLRGAVEVHAPYPAVPQPPSAQGSTTVPQASPVPVDADQSTMRSRSMGVAPRTLKSSGQELSKNVRTTPQPLPGRYAAISLKQAGFGGLGTPISLTEAGAQPFVAANTMQPPASSAQNSAESDMAGAKDSSRGASFNSRDMSTDGSRGVSTEDSRSASAGDAQKPKVCAPRPVKSNVTQGLNLTRPLGPAMLVARTPGQLFPVAWRQSPLPSTQDMTALVALAGVLTQQLQQLPMGRLARGIATTAVGTIANVTEAVAIEARAPLTDAWNITNQVARLGAQVAMQSFLSSAGAVLPITRAIYNRTSSWYRAAAAASNRAVDNAIADLSDQQQVLGDFAGTLASALQQLTFMSASAAANGYTGSGPAGISSSAADGSESDGTADASFDRSTIRTAPLHGGVPARGTARAPVPR